MSEVKLYKLEIVLREEKVDGLAEALGDIGHPAMTVTEVWGRGRQCGLQEQFRGRAYVIPFLPKVKVEVIVKEEDLRRVVSAVTQVARTGEVGDGKIFIYPIANAVRIRTGEEGAAAI